MEATAYLLGIPIETINALAGVATAVAAMLAALFAYRGLRIWRDEMPGRRKAELAEEVLADFYQVRDVFLWVRSPASYSSEADNRPRDDGEKEDLARELDSYFVPIARLNNDRTFLSAFRAKRYRFRAVFGDDADKPFQELRKIEVLVNTSANMLSRVARSDARRGRSTTSLSEEQRRKHEAHIWSTGENDDPISPRIDAAVKAIEDICRPAIKASHTNVQSV